MSLALARPALLSLCMAASFITMGHPPGAVNLRTREIEATIKSDAMTARTEAGRKPIGGA